MAGPLQRFGQAVGRFLGRRPPPPQRVYREPIGKPPRETPSGPINRPLPPEQRQKALYRVGFNPNQKGRIDPLTGERFLTGIKPTPSGVEGALRRVTGDRVQVRIFGQPAWNTREHTSPPPDRAGNVWTTFFINRAEFEQTLQTAPTMEDAIFQAGSYDFQQVLTVAVGNA